MHQMNFKDHNKIMINQFFSILAASDKNIHVEKTDFYHGIKKMGNWLPFAAVDKSLSDEIKEQRNDMMQDVEKMHYYPI